MTNTETLNKNIGNYISYRNAGSRRVTSGILQKSENGFKVKLGVLYMEIDPEKITILSITEK